jgi:hypothetical protein
MYGFSGATSPLSLRKDKEGDGGGRSRKNKMDDPGCWLQILGLLSGQKNRGICLKIAHVCWVQWLKPIVLTIWLAELGGSLFEEDCLRFKLA